MTNSVRVLQRKLKHPKESKLSKAVLEKLTIDNEKQEEESKLPFKIYNPPGYGKTDDALYKQ